MIRKKIKKVKLPSCEWATTVQNVLNLLMSYATETNIEEFQRRIDPYISGFSRHSNLVCPRITLISDPAFKNRVCRSIHSATLGKLKTYQLKLYNIKTRQLWWSIWNATLKSDMWIVFFHFLQPNKYDGAVEIYQ